MIDACMNESNLTFSLLETLSTENLIELGKSYALDFPPGLNRRFVIEEILEASSDELLNSSHQSEKALEFGKEPVQDAAATSLALLPDNYHATFVEVLLRDPLWAYVFWEIRGSERSEHEEASNFVCYALKVSTAFKTNSGVEMQSFSVNLEPDDKAWYLCLPAPGGWYKVELCLQKDKSETILAVSAPFRVPNAKIRLDPAAVSEKTQEYLFLSGLDDLRVLRGGDGTSRLLHRCE
ncbi:DUF4912 domain-containing protein [Treponema sp.]